MISNTELVLRILLSAIIGGIIGIEREAHNRPAGLRTHILVTTGAALIMLLSNYGFDYTVSKGDPARLAAQVVSGIGFLGAGTILRDGSNIKGLTTAASLWVCGGLGLAIGNGYYLGALVTTVIVFISLSLLSGFEKKFINKNVKIATLKCYERPGLIGDIGMVFGESGIMIKGVQISRGGIEGEDILEDITDHMEYGIIELEFALILDREFDYDSFNIEVSKVKGVERIKWAS